MRNRYLLILSAAVSLLVSCIENPLDYPYMPAGITVLEVEQQKSVSIDNAGRTVTVTLNEYADLANVRVKKYSYTDGASVSCQLPEQLDLTSPYKISYTTHPDQCYEWTIVAVQPIERYVICENMIGDAEFDLESKSVIAYFPETQELSEIRFNKMKLEALGSKIDSTYGYVSVDGNDVLTDDPVYLPMTLDCVISRRFVVKHNDKRTVWTFTAVHKIINLEVTSVNAWCYKADLEAVFKGVGNPRIECKGVSDSEWMQLATTVNGTKITASVDNLDPGTEYKARVVNGEEISDEYTFVTETPTQLDNMSFDDWYEGDPGGYTWVPGQEGVSSVWDCANKGVNMMSAINSTRPEEEFVIRGKAARMESTSVFGKFAAGNIYTGEFLRATISGGVGAELNWGTPFTSRPYSLRGYYSYAPAVIDNVSDEYADKKGNMDKCQILVFLTDWSEPFLVKTASNTFVDLQNDPSIIALGTIESDVNTNGYIPFECVLEYRDMVRKPKYIVAVACSSLYGDYFTGGLGSVMYVDEWEFTYR